MNMKPPLVLATRNEGKISEFKVLLECFGIGINSLKDFGPISPVEEDGQDFEDNAVKKKKQLHRSTPFKIVRPKIIVL